MMLTADLDANTSWSNGVSLQGLVRLDYQSTVDPWLVHASFLVAHVQDDHDIERMTLIHAMMTGLVNAVWIGTEGAPIRIAAGPAKIRFRITDPNTGASVDFDVRREELQTFLADTAALVSVADEKVALALKIEEGLEGL